MSTTMTNETDKGRVVYPDDSTVSARYRLNDIFCTAWLSHAITALVKCGAADAITDKPTSIEKIAKQTGTHTPSLYRALRAAAANGIFSEVQPGLFIHNEVSQLLRTDNPFSWKGMACMWNHPSCLKAWSEFPKVLTDGRSGIEHAFGEPLYKHLAAAPGATLAFSDAMISNSAHAAISIAKTFPFAGYKNVVDIGGGAGTLLAAILEEHKQLTGAIFEIAELEKTATSNLQSKGLASRAQVIVGDFMEALPAGFDLYMIKNSLWNWNDDNCSCIIRNVRNATGNDRTARFIIIEYAIEEPNASWTTLYDLQILTMPGGRARTLAEYIQLLSNNGFVLERIQHVEDQIMLIARPF